MNAHVETIKNAAKGMVLNCNNEDLLYRKESGHLPNRGEIIDTIKLLQKVIYTGYFDDANLCNTNPEYFLGNTLSTIYEKLSNQMMLALLYKNDENADLGAIKRRVDSICERFFEKLPAIQRKLLKDVEAGFNGDPAAKSKEEVIFSYPGLLAITIYRIAHELYVEEVPFIPRIMTEYAHSKTGIDINSGAVIGEYFFIDHGTGVVIGETTVIGDNVKLYQGVTLGALSTRGGQLLANVRRHPTIEDNVTIYANSTILGGETVIGHDSVIAGNSFIIDSVPPHTRVSTKLPELTFKGGKNA